MNYFEKNNILHPNQFGFRKNFSTTHAMLEIMNKVSNKVSAITLEITFDCATTTPLKVTFRN